VNVYKPPVVSKRQLRHHAELGDVVVLHRFQLVLAVVEAVADGDQHEDEGEEDA